MKISQVKQAGFYWALNGGDWTIVEIMMNDKGAPSTVSMYRTYEDHRPDEFDLDLYGPLTPPSDVTA